MQCNVMQMPPGDEASAGPMQAQPFLSSQLACILTISCCNDIDEMVCSTTKGINQPDAEQIEVDLAADQEVANENHIACD